VEWGRRRRRRRRRRRARRPRLLPPTPHSHLRVPLLDVRALVLAAGQGVPDPDGAVAAARGQRCAGRRPRDGLDLRLVPRQGRGLVPAAGAVGLPDCRGAVKGRGGEARAVGGERDAAHRARGSRGQGAGRGPGGAGAAPEADGAVGATRGEEVAWRKDGEVGGEAGGGRRRRSITPITTPHTLGRPRDRPHRALVPVQRRDRRELGHGAHLGPPAARGGAARGKRSTARRREGREGGAARLWGCGWRRHRLSTPRPRVGRPRRRWRAPRTQGDTSTPSYTAADRRG